MDARYALLALVAVSLLFLGCAKRVQEPANVTHPVIEGANGAAQPGAQNGGAAATPPAESGGTQPANQPAAEPAENASGTEAAESQPPPGDDGSAGLADLFNISTDKPVEGEGLDVETPASKE